eukprot:133465_1
MHICTESPNTMSNKVCFACDLKDDPNLITKYIQHHKEVWPKVKEDIQHQGIENMEIFHTGDRLFMIVTPTEKFTTDNGDFSWEKSSKVANRDDETVRILKKWEELMDVYQKRLPFAETGEKWVMMSKIFSLK